MSGRRPGLSMAGGDDEAEVYRELCQVVAEAVELYQSDGKPLPPATATREYSGRFVLRVGKELHQLIALRALQASESINSYCQKILKRSTG